MAIDSGSGGHDGGTKRQRAVGADAVSAPADRISALPDELRQRILTRIPLKDAIRTGVLARGWRDLWKSRWTHSASVEVRLRSLDALMTKLDALAREPRPRRRLDRFSLIVENCRINHCQLEDFTNYAAKCGVEDLHVEVPKIAWSKASFHVPLYSPLLTRLSLRGISITSNMRYNYKGLKLKPRRALEVIRLHSVSITKAGFRNMMALCPSLLTLDLRGCDCDCIFYQPDLVKNKRHSLVMLPNLRTVTVADCKGRASLDLVPVTSVRSFRYMGDFVTAPFSLPKKAKLTDLYICIGEKIPSCDLSTALPTDLSKLTVLTICSNALENVSSLLKRDCGPRPNLGNLESLEELQLILSGTEGLKKETLDNIYVFLKHSQCHNLERLFVQLPDISCQRLEDLVQGEQVKSPEDGLGNLRTIKVMNFNWHRFEVQLVSSLLRKATSLDKLLLVSPDITLQHMAGAQEADLLFLKKALANVKVVLSESDAGTTQPYHSEVFIKV